jgi:hypothetical protein
MRSLSLSNPQYNTKIPPRLDTIDDNGQTSHSYKLYRLLSLSSLNLLLHPITTSLHRITTLWHPYEESPKPTPHRIQGACAYISSPSYIALHHTTHVAANHTHNHTTKPYRHPPRRPILLLPLVRNILTLPPPRRYLPLLPLLRYLPPCHYNRLGRSPLTCGKLPHIPHSCGERDERVALGCAYETVVFGRVAARGS